MINSEKTLLCEYENGNLSLDHNLKTIGIELYKEKK